jgi:hypothetical protein
MIRHYSMLAGSPIRSLNRILTVVVSIGQRYATSVFDPHNPVVPHRLCKAPKHPQGFTLIIAQQIRLVTIQNIDSDNRSTDSFRYSRFQKSASTWASTESGTLLSPPVPDLLTQHAAKDFLDCVIDEVVPDTSIYAAQVPS